MPFLDANKEAFVAEVIMNITPDAEQDEELDSE